MWLGNNNLSPLPFRHYLAQNPCSSVQPVQKLNKLNHTRHRKTAKPVVVFSRLNELNPTTNQPTNRLPPPVAPNPHPTTGFLCPVPCYPDTSGIRRLGPPAASEFICTTAGLPFLIYPYMSRAGCNHTLIVWSLWPYLYKYLGIAGKCDAAQRYSQQ